MSSLKYQLYDVFTRMPFSGNPLAVFLDAHGLSSELKARIANELNLSETVFLERLDGGSSWRLRIYTPQAELPFAGHPTIGAAIALRDAGLATNKVDFELELGAVHVTVDERRASLAAPIQASKVGTTKSTVDCAELLGIEQSEVIGVTGASAGVPFAFVELGSRMALRKCSLSLGHWRDEWADSSTPHVYSFYRRSASQIDARMFAPAMGIQEDPATGGAAAAMAALLPDGFYDISQGEDMGRQSHMALRVTGDRATISGEAVRIGSGEFIDLLV
ncbi:PhzF family phenazine biosynthesis protein [Altererythrobacter arenosus]|uniref:PhzF family phenazine biosynthesis protein n=1 Tax=Altererythrobacter arenosus TaxID=3032592 RepID=A0ABY8FSA5_9SPHN|nr:PhzF family phenazine biosynthesis protein [Altererythrobacter sp. CAU 1644]WFL77717.1 PhzF family phenazine biosynthesis protein [Altererythrobacter sp. CAU 1644]